MRGALAKLILNYIPSNRRFPDGKLPPAIVTLSSQSRPPYSTLSPARVAGGNSLLRWPADISDKVSGQMSNAGTKFAYGGQIRRGQRGAGGSRLMGEVIISGGGLSSQEFLNGDRLSKASPGFFSPFPDGLRDVKGNWKAERAQEAGERLLCPGNR